MKSISMWPDSNYIGINRRDPWVRGKWGKLCSEAATSDALESWPNSELCCGHRVDRSTWMENIGAASQLCAPLESRIVLMGTSGGYLGIMGVWSEKDHAAAITEERGSGCSVWRGADTSQIQLWVVWARPERRGIAESLHMQRGWGFCLRMVNLPVVRERAPWTPLSWKILSPDGVLCLLAKSPALFGNILMCYLCGKEFYWHIFHIMHKQF